MGNEPEDRTSIIARQWWRPGIYGRRRPYLHARAAMLRAIRDHFAAADFLEVETPALQISPGLEPHLKAFVTELEAPDGTLSWLYLHTSPEFAMKKLLVAGEPRIFQLARAYRNGERSDTHHPEFTMLEWYRAGADYTALMDDCEQLLRATLAASGNSMLRWQNRTSDPSLPWQRLTVADAFRTHAGIDLPWTIPADRGPDVIRLRGEAKRAGIRTTGGDSWDDVFFRIFLTLIEPQLGTPVPTILYDYPIHMAALARPKPGNDQLAERFELYVSGLEIANAFSELTDATAQRRRFMDDLDLKRQLYGTAYPIDEDFLEALAYPLPESAGIALGVDRLVMLATGASKISDVLWAPVAERGLIKHF